MLSRLVSPHKAIQSPRSPSMAILLRFVANATLLTKSLKWTPSWAVGLFRRYQPGNAAGLKGAIPEQITLTHSSSSCRVAHNWSLIAWNKQFPSFGVKGRGRGAGDRRVLRYCATWVTHWCWKLVYRLPLTWKLRVDHLRCLKLKQNLTLGHWNTVKPNTGNRVDPEPFVGRPASTPSFRWSGV